MAGVALVTDSTASLPAEQVAARGVSVVPLQVVIDGISRPESDPAAGPAAVAHALGNGQVVTTSRPPMEAFATIYADLAAQGFDEVVSAHLSRALSGTCEAAEVAAATAPLPVQVIDTGTVAMGCGFAVLAGARAASRGRTGAAVAEVVRRRAKDSWVCFCPDSLDYLQRGGRIGAAAALIGQALSVKPLLKVDQGRIQAFERVRTSSKALTRLAELGGARIDQVMAPSGSTAGPADSLPVVEIAIHHLENPEAAGFLTDWFRRRCPSARVLSSPISAVLGVHAGPGTVGVVISVGG